MKTVEENALGGKEKIMNEINLQDWVANEVQELEKTVDKTVKILEEKISVLKTCKSEEAKKNIEELASIINAAKESIQEKEYLRDYIIPEKKRDELSKDYDGDGLTNYEELQNGTNPYERDSDHDGIDDKDDKYKDYDDNELEY